MTNFEKELKRLGDIEFNRIRSRYQSKVTNKNTVESAVNNLGIFEKSLSELTKTLEKIGNELYPQMGVSDKDAQRIFKKVVESYLPKIKNLSRF